MSVIWDGRCVRCHVTLRVDVIDTRLASESRFFCGTCDRDWRRYGVSTCVSLKDVNMALRHVELLRAEGNGTLVIEPMDQYIPPGSSLADIRRLQSGNFIFTGV